MILSFHFGWTAQQIHKLETGRRGDKYKNINASTDSIYPIESFEFDL